MGKRKLSNTIILTLMCLFVAGCASGPTTEDWGEFYITSRFNAEFIALSAKNYLLARSIARANLDYATEKFGQEHYLTALAHQNLGSAYFMSDNYQGAEESFLMALSIEKKLYQKDIVNDEGLYEDLGDTYYMLKDCSQASYYYELALSLYIKRLGEFDTYAVPNLREKLKIVTTMDCNELKPLPKPFGSLRAVPVP